MEFSFLLIACVVLVVTFLWFFCVSVRVAHKIFKLFSESPEKWWAPGTLYQAINESEYVTRNALKFLRMSREFEQRIAEIPGIKEYTDSGEYSVRVVLIRLKQSRNKRRRRKDMFILRPVQP